jgi:hypothetical protein
VLAACFVGQLVAAWSRPSAPGLAAACAEGRGGMLGLYARAMCASEVGPDDATQLGTAAASHAIQAVAVVLVVALGWRARERKDGMRSLVQLAAALAVLATGAVGIYACWQHLPLAYALPAELAIVIAMRIAGGLLVRRPYTFGVAGFSAIAIAVLVGGPLGVAIGAMPGAWFVAGLLGTVGPAVAMLFAFVHPDRGATWEHLRRR